MLDNMPAKKTQRVAIHFKNGTVSCIEANYLFEHEGIVQIWNGETSMVGIFNLSDIAGILMTESGK